MARRTKTHASVGTETTPTADDVARRASELYEQRGRGDGRDWDDWFQAEPRLQRVNAADVAA